VVNLSAKIKEVSSKSVPGLSEDFVSVMLVPSRIEVILPEGGQDQWIFTSPRFLGGAIVIVAIAGFLFWRKLAAKKSGDSKLGSAKKNG
jgi:type III secretory pathway lipoprotein EscJ